MTERQIELDVEAYVDAEYLRLYDEWKVGIIDDHQYRVEGHKVDVEANKRFAEAMANLTELVD